ncbi:MAG TPA: hypothetical protein PK992_06725 [Planctomycetaceae bacterium]|nr:hypothetical protein [Planctomycetaceae bacterium]
MLPLRRPDPSLTWLDRNSFNDVSCDGLLTVIAEFCRSGISVAGNALHFAERNFPTQEIDDWREQFLRVFFKNLARLVKLIGSAPVSTSF